MSSLKLRLLTATYDWILESGLTPQIVAKEGEGLVVPKGYVANGEITLNISPSAVVDCLFSDKAITFKARFSGTPHTISIPIGLIKGIFARENQQGVGFGALDSEQVDAEDVETSEGLGVKEGKKRKVHLEVVK